MKQFLTILSAGLIAAAKDCNRDRPLEVFVLQDGTASFSNFLVQSRTLFTEFMNQLTSEVDHVRSGIALFGDKPNSRTSRDICWGELSALSEDKQRFLDAASTLSQLCNGGDLPEDGWEVLAYAAGSAAGYTPAVQGDNITRIAILVTDEPSHESSRVANPNLANEIDCRFGSVYPPLSQIREILDQTAVHPIILASTVHAREYWSNALFNRMGYSDKEAAVHPFQMNANDLVAVLLDAVKEMECNVEETVPTTPPPTESPTLPPTTAIPPTEPSTIPSTTANPPIVSPTSTDEAPVPPLPTEGILPTGSPEGGPNVGIIIGAAAGGAALMAGVGALSVVLRNRNLPPEETFDVEDDQDIVDDNVPREAVNPTTSADYGTYGEEF